MTLAIPATSADITPAWIAGALAESFPNIDVSEVEVRPIGTGQMASSLRVRMVPAGTPDPSVPDSVVVKMASSDSNSRDAGARGAYLKEVRFYQEFAHELPVATPTAYWSGIDLDTNDFAVVLQDMSGARQGDQIAGCSLDQVEMAVRNIAGLHAPRWNDESLLDHAWLSAPPEQHEEIVGQLKALMAVATPGFIARYDGRLDDYQIELLEWFAATIDEWILGNDGPVALLHGDHRLDNLLFDESGDGPPVTVVDWQTIAVRNPVADISYLLGTSVEPDVRRRIETDMVGVYHRELVSLGVSDFDATACFEAYRTQSPHALLLSVLGSMLTVQTDRGDDMFMAMMSRSAHQIADLDVR